MSTADPDLAEAFDAKAREALLRHARHLVEATVRDEPLPAAISESWGAIPCHGLFVTLKRGGLLRGCVGHYRIEEAAPIGEMLERSAPAAATRDTRFPPVMPGELPFLTLELTPMHRFREIGDIGNERAAAVEIGRHGVILSQGAKRGLLLPQVAVEQGYDARTFLEQVSAKAGLPKGAWLEADSRLVVFEGTPFAQDSPKPEIDPSRFPHSVMESLARLAEACGRRETGEIRVPAEVARTWEHLIGAVVESGGRRSLAVNSGVSYGELIRDACRSLGKETGGNPLAIDSIFLLSLPIPLRAVDHPGRHAAVARMAVMVRKGKETGLSIAGTRAAAEPHPVVEALSSVGLDPGQWESSGAEVTAFQRHRIVIRRPSGVSPDGNGDATRPAAVAGRFYPASAAEIESQLDAFFGESRKPEEGEAVRAVMVPHAGWAYCGDIIAETLGRARVPEVVMVIGPKHTSSGANWSVSGSSAWRTPNATIPVAAEWADFLAGRCPGLVRETAAHQSEHGCEVLLPFLHRRNPSLRIVPIAIGEADFEDLTPLADALAAMRARLGDRFLQVISSDMNHFASDRENRRRDALALARLKAADPRGLYDTCLANDISMCGLRPAVAVMRALEAERAPEIEVIRYDTSARVSGDFLRVVGYAGAVMR